MIVFDFIIEFIFIDKVCFGILLILLKKWLLVLIVFGVKLIICVVILKGVFGLLKLIWLLWLILRIWKLIGLVFMIVLYCFIFFFKFLVKLFGRLFFLKGLVLKRCLCIK